MRLFTYFFVSLALFVGATSFTQPAAAQTSEELQQIIDVLYAEIELLGGNPDRVETEGSYGDMQQHINNLLAEMATLQAAQETLCVDWDGDGWGWDGEKGCKIEDDSAEPETPADPEPSTTECYDWDGDGWGWDGEKGCVMSDSKDELLVRWSSDNPDASTLVLKDDDYSPWYTVFAFELDAVDSTSDIELYELPLALKLSTSSYDEVIGDVELIIDGTVIDDVAIENGNTRNAIMHFNVDGDVDIDAGVRVEAFLDISFRPLATANEGMRVAARITPEEVSDIQAESSDTLSEVQVRGHAFGANHKLRTKGAIVQLADTSAFVTAVDGSDNDYATYEVELEITAVEQDVYIATDAATALEFSIWTPGGEVAAGVLTSTLSSTADETGSYFQIHEGETESFFLTVTFDPAEQGTYARLVLHEITYDDAGTSSEADDKVHKLVPVDSFQTNIKYIAD